MLNVIYSEMPKVHGDKHYAHFVHELIKLVVIVSIYMREETFEPHHEKMK